VLQILENKSSIKMLYEPTPASIPSHDRVFGYEEKGDGSVINQNPKQIVSSEHIGPGSYDVDQSYSQALTYSNSGFKFFNAERRTFLNQGETLDIGLGDYDPPQTEK